MTEAAQFAEPLFSEYLDRLTALHRTIDEAVADLPDEALDWTPGPDMNSLGVLLAHTAGSMRYWIGDMAGNDDSSRVRQTEFETVGVGLAEMRGRLAAAVEHSARVLERLTTADLTQTRQPFTREGRVTVAWALLHALEHTAIHAGHIQITRQLWDRLVSKPAAKVSSKAELMRRIADGREAFERALAGLDEATLSRPDPATGWAVKDHLFHLAMWERGIARLLQRRSRYEGMGITAQEWRDLDMDETNELIFRRNRERTTAEALATFHEAHQEMLDALAPLSLDDLMRPYAAYDLEEGLFPDRPVIGWVIADTYEHFEEHLGYLQSLLAT